MNSKRPLTEGKILPALTGFALPVLLALFLQTAYGAVDLWVVSKYAADFDISAVSTGSWLMHMVTTFVVGVSMGTTVLLGRHIGEKRGDEAGRVVGASIVLFLLLGVVITAVMQIFAEPLVRIMQTPAAAFDATVSYVRICSAGTVFIVAYNVLGAVFRGLGDSKMPLITVFIACVFNIGGDLLLVGGFGMATAGAAIATVAAQALSVVISLAVIKRRGLPFEFKLRQIGFDRRRMLSVLRIGFPVAFQDMLVSISFLVITAIVNTLGVVPSAGVGIAEKLCGFIMLVPSAFNQSMAAFVSQNLGANQPGRAKRALLCGIGLSLAVGVVMAWLSYFHGDLLVSIFAKDGADDVVAAAAEYLRAYAIDCLLVSVMFCMVGYFNGCGRTIFVMAQGIIGAFGVRIPVSFFMSRLEPVSLFMVGLATPASTAVQIVLCLGYYAIISRSDNRLSA